MQISKSVYNSSFKEIIKDKYGQESYNVIDQSWLQFLMDYRDIIKKSSTYYKLKEEEMLRYRYRIRDFLVERGYKPMYELIFRVINRLHDNHEFTIDTYGVWLPDMNKMIELKQTYETENTLRKSLDTNMLLQQKKFLN